MSGDEEDKCVLKRKKNVFRGMTKKWEKIREKRSVEELRKLINSEGKRLFEKREKKQTTL